MHEVRHEAREEGEYSSEGSGKKRLAIQRTGVVIYDTRPRFLLKNRHAALM